MVLFPSFVPQFRDSWRCFRSPDRSPADAYMLTQYVVLRGLFCRIWLSYQPFKRRDMINMYWYGTWGRNNSASWAISWYFLNQDGDVHRAIHC